MAVFKHTLYEGVLNDDYIVVEEDKSALLTYYTYATEWSNNVNEKAFDTIDRAIRWYRRNFGGRVLEQGKVWLDEDRGYGAEYGGTPEEYWTDVVYEQGMEI